MSFWGWAAAIAAGWFTASALFAITWNTVGKRIFRKPPAPPRRVDSEDADWRSVSNVYDIDHHGGV